MKAQPINPNPEMETYGYYNSNSFCEESGWMCEGGEEAYFEALEKWEKSQQTNEQ